MKIIFIPKFIKRIKKLGRKRLSQNIHFSKIKRYKERLETMPKEYRPDVWRYEKVDTQPRIEQEFKNEHVYGEVMCDIQN